MTTLPSSSSSGKNFGWEDEEHVDVCRELLHFSVDNYSVSIQEIRVKGRECCRVSVGNLYGSESVHLDTLRNTVIAANRLVNHLVTNRQLVFSGKRMKILDATRFEGFIRREKRAKEKK